MAMFNGITFINIRAWVVESAAMKSLDSFPLHVALLALFRDACSAAKSDSCAAPPQNTRIPASAIICAGLAGVAVFKVHSYTLDNFGPTP